MLRALPRVGLTRHAPTRLLLLSAAGLLLLWSVSRGLLLMLSAERWQADLLPGLLATGLRVDLIAVGVALALPILLWPLLASRHTEALWWRLSRGWIGLIAVAALVLEIATPTFIAQYESRPNHLAVEYLRDWDSVLPMLWVGFRLPLLAGLGVLLAGLVLVGRAVRAPIASAPAAAPVWLLAAWLPLVALDVLLIRNSLDHRPANPSLFARWSDHLLNHLVLNSSYSFGYAVYAQRHERAAAEVYGPLDEARFQAAIHQDPRFREAPADHPTWHHQSPSQRPARPRPLLIVVEESLGADFSARLGGQGLTPELDRWADRGLWFERLYATGTRSARGLEAIVAGFPPSPAPAVLKREGAQHGFATLASVLQGFGYHSRFLYGGGAHFDNMRGFFLGNGFEAVIERSDYPAPRHLSSWGVSDEDLFERALLETDAAHARGEAFFHLVFTSSHHEPFDIPAGRLPAVYDQPGTPAAAVRYADLALGDFLDQASTRPWFKDTVVLVVADHDVRVYGEEVIPIRRFQIPGLILGADLPAQPIRSLASQIDLAPTLLSLMGIEADLPFPGRDLTATLPEFGHHEGPPPRAILQFENRYAWLLDQELQVLLPGGEAQRWRVQADGTLGPPLPAPSAEQLEALHAQALLADWLYRQHAYTLPAAAGEGRSGRLR